MLLSFQTVMLTDLCGDCIMALFTMVICLFLISSMLVKHISILFLEMGEGKWEGSCSSFSSHRQRCSSFNKDFHTSFDRYDNVLLKMNFIQGESTGFLFSFFFLQQSIPSETMGALWPTQNRCDLQESTRNVIILFCCQYFNFTFQIGTLWPNSLLCLIIRNRLKEEADNIGLPTFVVADAGRTQVILCSGIIIEISFTKKRKKKFQNCLETNWRLDHRWYVVPKLTGKIS